MTLMLSFHIASPSEVLCVISARGFFHQNYDLGCIIMDFGAE